MEILAQLIDIAVHLDKYLAVLVQQYGTGIYLILFAIVFCETGLVVMPFLPGDSLLFVAGALAAVGGMDMGVLMAVLFAAALLGDNTNYWIGRTVGKKLEHHRWVNQQALAATHAFYERHGGKTMAIARFMPFVRTFAPFVAGLGTMSYGRYFLFDLLGAVLWVGSLTVAGYLFGNVAWIKSNLTLIILSVVGLSLLPVFVGWLRHRRSRALEQS